MVRELSPIHPSPQSRDNLAPITTNIIFDKNAERID